MNTSVDNDNNYSLHNVDNFRKSLDRNESEIVEKYVNIACEYLNHIIDNIKIKEVGYTQFIILRGFETYTNVFNNLLYYTKNIDITFYHCQKTYYYYVEFIEQITDDQNTFLQLSSRDAAMYVYKKTIFDINNEFQKNVTIIEASLKKQFDIINKYIKIFRIIFSKLINSANFNVLEKEKTVELIKTCEEFCKNIINKKYELAHINDVEKYIDLFDSKIEDINIFLNLGIMFFKKVSKNLVLLNKCKDKLMSSEFECYIEEYDINNFILWFTK
jgi:hypothetical protein